ncbi:MAG TPA: IS4 family transposase, partial [Ginsengibacter sp.]
DTIEFESNGFYIMDRGFVDYERLFTIQQQQAYFITRAKTNMKCRRIYSAKVDKTTGVLYDQTIQLVNFYVSKQYPKKLRRVKYFDKETNKKFIFLTNNFEIAALQVAQLYKYRWKIELFFKWIKQHLKVKSFWGHSENAVKGAGVCCHNYFCSGGISKTKTKNITHTIPNITDFELNTSQQNSLKSTVSRRFNTICQRTAI